MTIKKENNYYVVVYFDNVNRSFLSFEVSSYSSQDLPQKIFLNECEIVEDRKSKMFHYENNSFGLRYFFSEEGIESILYSGRQLFINDKKKLLLEYKIPIFNEMVIFIETNWGQCPNCLEIFEIEEISFELCVCPSCEKIWVNSEHLPSPELMY